MKYYYEAIITKGNDKWVLGLTDSGTPKVREGIPPEPLTGNFEIESTLSIVYPTFPAVDVPEEDYEIVLGLILMAGFWVSYLDADVDYNFGTVIPASESEPDVVY